MSVTTTFLAADEVVVFAPDETPASSEKEPPEIPALKNLSDVRLLPIFSVTQNIAATFRLKNALQKRETLHPDAVNYLDNALLFTLITEFPQTSWTPPSIFRIDAMMTRPAISYYGDFVVPVWPELLEAMKSEGDAKLLEPNVYDADGVLIVVSDRYCACSYGEDIAPTDEDIARLRRLIQETEASTLKNVASIATAPQAIGRSALKPELAGLRAQLMAEAQQRDDDTEFDSLTRGLWQRLQISAFDAFFNDTEQLSFTVDHDEAGQALIVELDVRCTKRSTLDKYIAEIGATRSRVLSYLHPNYVGFVSASIPLSEEIASALPRIAALGADIVIEEEGWLPAAFQQTLEKIADKRQAEYLIQAVTTNQDSTACVMVMPLEQASTLRASLILLVYASTSTLNAVGEVAGFPVTEFPAIEIPGLEPQRGIDGKPSDTKAMFVATDQCLAVMFGTEKDLPLLETILKRDFEPQAAATRFQQSVFAAEVDLVPLSELENMVFGNSHLLAKPKNEDDESPQPAGKIQVYMHTAPQRLMLTARFEGDTMIAGITFLESTIELLAVLFEY